MFLCYVVDAETKILCFAYYFLCCIISSILLCEETIIDSIDECEIIACAQFNVFLECILSRSIFNVFISKNIEFSR